MTFEQNTQIYEDYAEQLAEYRKLTPEQQKTARPPEWNDSAKHFGLDPESIKAAADAKAKEIRAGKLAKQKADADLAKAQSEEVAAAAKAQSASSIQNPASAPKQ